MRNFYRSLVRILISVSIMLMAPFYALPQAATGTASDPAPVVPVPNPCMRFKAGSVDYSEHVADRGAQ